MSQLTFARLRVLERKLRDILACLLPQPLELVAQRLGRLLLAVLDRLQLAHALREFCALPYELGTYALVLGDAPLEGGELGPELACCREDVARAELGVGRAAGLQEHAGGLVRSRWSVVGAKRRAWCEEGNRCRWRAGG